MQLSASMWERKNACKWCGITKWNYFA